MPHLVLTNEILARPEVCFGLSLDVDLHTQSTGAREEIVGGVRSGQMALGDEVTWKAWHFGIPFRMTSKIVEYEKPLRFVDEQTRGPFASWHHEHRFEESDGSTLMTDIVDYRSPMGAIGSVVDRIRLERYMVELRKFLGRLKLLVNEEKMKLVSAWTGFDFLGVTFRKQRIPKRPSVAMCYVWPSRRSMQRIRDKVRVVVSNGLQPSLSEKIVRLNRVIRGWGTYFRLFNSARAFTKVDYYVWQNLTRWIRRKHHTRTRVIKGSPTTLYRREGLVTLRGTVQYAR